MLDASGRRRALEGRSKDRRSKQAAAGKSRSRFQQAMRRDQSDKQYRQHGLQQTEAGTSPRAPNSRVSRARRPALQQPRNTVRGERSGIGMPGEKLKNRMRVRRRPCSAGLCARNGRNGHKCDRQQDPRASVSSSFHARKRLSHWPISLLCHKPDCLPQCPPAGPPPMWNRRVISTSGAASSVRMPMTRKQSIKASICVCAWSWA